MTRTLSPSLGAVVETLEMDQPQVVTMADVRRIVESHHLRTDPKLVALRLRRAGWLLETGVRGVWEFAPGAHAGPIGHADPLGAVKAISARFPDLPVQVALSTAAWAGGYADRVPATPEVAVPPGLDIPRTVTTLVRVTRFSPRLDPIRTRGTFVHRPETVLVHMAHRPADVRSWSSAAEWLPDLAADANPDLVHTELGGRSKATRARFGYLLQGLRPDLVEALRSSASTKTWFGPRGPLRHHSQEWQVADTVLPFDPAALTGDV